MSQFRATAKLRPSLEARRRNHVSAPPLFTKHSVPLIPPASFSRSPFSEIFVVVYLTLEEGARFPASALIRILSLMLRSFADILAEPTILTILMPPHMDGYPLYPKLLTPDALSAADRSRVN
jgi:hypothetical protein